MSKQKFKWPLATNNFSFWDRLKICAFFLNKKNRWTQDKYVRQYEYKVADYVGVNYAVYVSSGSAANQLIAQYRKDQLVKSGEWPKRNKVVLSTVTWQTNCSVWLREGFEPIFLDIQFKDFAIDEILLEKTLKERGEEIAAVFPTSVLGYTPNIEFYRLMQRTYNVKFYLDNCENFFGQYSWEGYPDSYTFNINYPFTCSTSTFLAHQIVSGGEGGFIFTNDANEYLYYIMARAHGLSRNLYPYKMETIFSGSPPWPDLNSYYPWEYEPIHNELVGNEFNFVHLSSNYRNTDVSAYCGLLDFKHVNQNRLHRKHTYELFRSNLDPIRYYLPEDRIFIEDVAFCLPIIVKGEGKNERLKKVKEHLLNNGIEYRPFISGNMLRQTCYKKYGNYKDFPNAEYINNNAIYIGLNPFTSQKDIVELTNVLNKL